MIRGAPDNLRVVSAGGVALIRRVVLDRNFSARLDCHYLLQTTDRMDERTPLVVTLHGFGGNPESMLTMTERLFEVPPVVAALEGLFQFFLSTTAREVGDGWITNRRPAESIRRKRIRRSKPRRLMVCFCFGWQASPTPLTPFNRPIAAYFGGRLRGRS